MFVKIPGGGGMFINAWGPIRNETKSPLEILGTTIVKQIGNKMGYPLDNNFTYHAPKEGQNDKYVALRAKAKELAALVLELVPESRERSVALTEIETAVFWANAGIARN